MGEKMQYKDILYETRGSAVWITINRPDKYNAFRGVTCEELIHAITRAGWDKSVAAIVLTGAGEKAFCTGGDQSAHDGGYDGRGTIGLPVEELQSSIRDVPKPMIARVNGFAIETRKSEPPANKERAWCRSKRAIRRRAEKPLPARALKRDQRRHGVFFAEIFLAC